jgi:acetyl-CoA acetyltransferase
LRATRPDELAAVAIKAALERVPQLDPKEIEDVILGCAMPEAEQGMNVARIASLRAGLPSPSTASARRACSRLPWLLSALAQVAPKRSSPAARNRCR